ncbi:hypothetical protein B0H12DRAFT_1147799 [Mycena haematopus]|nr:hypothetical protein B0H12DRAFT_1147799 [Mycena haematopus]
MVRHRLCVLIDLVSTGNGCRSLEISEVCHREQFPLYRLWTLSFRLNVLGTAERCLATNDLYHCHTLSSLLQRAWLGKASEMILE